MAETLLNGRRVLICEDEAVTVKGLSRAVKFMGCDNVESCASGEEAVEFALLHHPDLILMDINLGGISGIEAVRRIRQGAQSCVIVISGWGHEETRRTALEAGANGFLSKPVTTPDTVDAVREYCEFHPIPESASSPRRRTS